MSRSEVPLSTVDQSDRMERYYRFHSKIYDATRWSFLFGRGALIQRISAHQSPRAILEVGCGTGKNLVSLARHFPEAHITGLDVSEAMLTVAGKNLGSLTGQVTLLHRAYDRPIHPLALRETSHLFDFVLFSYSLTMINPGWDRAIEHAYSDLGWGGLIAVVDFHDTAVPVFRRWMALNHVRMDGHLLPHLKHHFDPQLAETRPVYGGLWRYLMFIGEKAASSS